MPAANNRIDNIQALRFIAAALVLLTHITFYIRERVNSEVSVWHPGEIGVPIFFVISGFVMQLTAPAFANKLDGARQFLIRRISRVCPLYWIITTLKIVLAFAVPAAVLHNRPDLEHILASYVFFPMFNGDGEVRPIHGVGWTLFHEMFFYSLFALGLFGKISPWKLCTGVITVLVIVGLVLKVNLALYLVLTNPINLMFVAGMFIAKLYQTGFKIPAWVSLLIALGAFAALNSHLIAEFKKFYFADFPFEAIFIVLGLLYLPVLGVQRLRRVFNTLGDASYSLYLCHPIVAPAICVVLFKLGVTSVPLIVVAAVVGTVVIATLVHFLVENPANRLMRNSMERKGVAK